MGIELFDLLCDSPKKSPPSIVSCGTSYFHLFPYANHTKANISLLNNTFHLKPSIDTEKKRVTSHNEQEQNLYEDKLTDIFH